MPEPSEEGPRASTGSGQCHLEVSGARPSLRALTQPGQLSPASSRVGSVTSGSGGTASVPHFAASLRTDHMGQAMFFLLVEVL